MKINFINKDKKLKIVSLVIAIVIWFYIMGDLGYNILFFNNKNDLDIKRIKNVPISIMQRPQDLKGNVTISPISIDIEIKGRKNILKNVSKRNLYAYVDISDFDIGAYFSIVKVLVPEGVSLEGEIKTATVEIAAKWNGNKKKV